MKKLYLEEVGILNEKTLANKKSVDYINLVRRIEKIKTILKQFLS
jgi:hypothetical protein